MDQALILRIRERAYHIWAANGGDADQNWLRAETEILNNSNRRLKTGTVLVREYNGERHTVTVVPDGFRWRDMTYSSLSIIAQAITGTKWNGPRFFGLRVRSQPNNADAVIDAQKQKPAKPNRSSVRASDHRGSNG